MGSFHSRGGIGGGPVLLTGMGPTTGVIRLICEPNPTLEIRGKRLSPKAKNSENREKKKTPETKRQDRYVKGNHTTATDNSHVNNHNHRTTTKAGQHQQQRPTHNGAARLTSQTRRRTSKNSEDEGRHNDDADDDNNEGNHSAASKSSRVNLNQLDQLPAIDSPEAINVSAIRMKYMMKKLKRDSISKTDIIKNIQYVVSVLEKVYDNEKRRLLEEEQELSDVVETDSVSGVIKEWLTSTFTRSMSNMARKPDDRIIKFRSVANAIRAGIVVDRIYRRMSSSAGLHVPPNVLLQMKNIDAWSFDVFQVNDIGENHALKYVGYEVLVKYDIIRKFKINSLSLDNFLLKLEQGYGTYNNPYHNQIHAADVTQTLHSILTDSKLSYWLTDMEIFATIIASLVHDYEHTGTTNAFHINTGSDFALLYNDKAVLENHHASSAFRLLKDENLNIVSNLTREQHKEFRALVIEMVLSTDMSFHFQQIKNMKNLLTLSEPSIDKTKALSLIVHCADISHPAKEWRMHLQWTNRLIEEFFRQGDKESELGLPISPLCDRKTTNISESQIGFIDFIVDPSFQVMADMLEKLSAPIKEQHQRDDIRAKAAAARAAEQKKAAKAAKVKSGLSSASSSSSSSVDSQQDSVEMKMSQIWANCFSTNKQRWRERAEREAQKAAEMKSEEDGEAKGVPAAAEAETETTTQQQDNDSALTINRQDAVTVTSIHVRAAPDEDNAKPPTKNDRSKEDDYNSDVTDSDDLALSSTSSVIDEADTTEDDARRKQTKKDQ